MVLCYQALTFKKKKKKEVKKSIIEFPPLPAEGVIVHYTPTQSGIYPWFKKKILSILLGHQFDLKSLLRTFCVANIK